jgi:hypothetical protein
VPPKTAPVIFLDIDGVLNTVYTKNAWVWFGRPEVLEKELVARMADLADRADAAVVLSSTWRTCDVGLPGTVLSLEARGWASARDRIRDATPHLPRESRGAEIQAWLDKHSEVTNYVVVDDTNDGLGALAERLVQTDRFTGLQDEHVDRALALLGVASGDPVA